jgi:hypothetical protein
MKPLLPGLETGTLTHTVLHLSHVTAPTPGVSAAEMLNAVSANAMSAKDRMMFFMALYVLFVFALKLLLPLKGMRWEIPLRVAAREVARSPLGRIARKAQDGRC